MRISTSYISQRSVDSMLQKQAELAKTQNQVSTGKRINSPSEDPAASVKMLDLQRQLNLNEQYIKNADTAENKLTITDGTLSGAADILQRIRELAVQGLNDTNDATARKAIAAEITQLNEALVSLANTKDANGESIFAGYQSGADAFNSTTPYAYNGDSGQRNIRVSDGYSVEINEPGDQVFVSSTVAGPSQAIFKTIDDFVTALNANTVGTAPNDGEFLTNMSTAMDEVSGARTRVGTKLNAIATQRTINEDINVSNQAILSKIGDLDYAEAITQLNLQSTGLQAAQQAYVKVQGLSLFNYL